MTIATLRAVLVSVVLMLSAVVLHDPAVAHSGPTITFTPDTGPVQSALLAPRQQRTALPPEIRDSVISHAQSGPIITFTPGTGPLGSTLLEPEQLAALPPEIRDFMTSHRVGDTWTVTIFVASDPSQPVFGPPGAFDLERTDWGSMCYSADFCDVYRMSTDVGYAGLGWWTRVTSSATATRPESTGIWITEMTHEMRHHWRAVAFPDAADFPVAYSSSYTSGSVNTWVRSAETGGVFQYVSWFAGWELIELPGGRKFLLPTRAPGYYATFTGSQQSQIVDSRNVGTNICFSQQIETLTWRTTVTPCSYPTRPLP